MNSLLTLRYCIIFVDFGVGHWFTCQLHPSRIIVLVQDFHVDAMENFVEEASVPVITFFDKDPNNRPFVIKFFNNANAKVNGLFGWF